MVYRRTKRSEKVRETSRSKFLAAARRLFRTRGFEGTTIQQIVKEAASSVGNLYFYFRNKEALLKAVVSDAFETIWSVAEEAMASVPRGPGRLVALQHVNVLAAFQHPDLAQLVLSDQYPSLVELIENVQEPRFKRLLAENLPPMSEVEMELAVSVWAGAARNAMLQNFKKKLDMTPDDLSRYIGRYNLRALGLGDEEIDEALAAIEQLDNERLGSAVDVLRPKETKAAKSERGGG